MERQMEKHTQPGLKSILMIIVNPGGFLKSHLNKFHWVFGPMVSGVAFAMFFLQTGLDMNRTGALGFLTLFGFCALGFVYGTVGIALLSVLAVGVSKLFGGSKDLKWTLKAFGLGYTPTLVYVILGIAFNLLMGWNTSIAFGVTGVLWALNPMIHSIKELTNGRLALSLVMTTVLGSLTLLGWGVLGTLGA